MTKARELLDLIADFVEARNGGSARPLEDIADEFGQVLSALGDGAGTGERIPPIVDHEADESRP